MKTGRTLIEEIHASEVPAGHCAWWWLGQQGFVVKLGTTVCWLDAYLTPNPSRQVAPLVAAEEVTGAALVLGSHDHEDHIDRQSWPAIAKASPGAKFIVPKLLREKIARELGIADQRVLGIDEGIVIQHDAVTVTAVPAAHEFWIRTPRRACTPTWATSSKAAGSASTMQAIRVPMKACRPGCGDGRWTWRCCRSTAATPSVLPQAASAT